LLGRWVWWPETPTGTGASSSASPPYRGLRPRVFSTRRPFSQLQVQDSVIAGGARCWDCVYPDSKRLHSNAKCPFFTIWPRSCASSERRSAVNQGRGSLFQHTGCTTQWIYGLIRPRGAFAAISEVLRDRTARARRMQQPPATAALSDRLRFCMCRLVLCGSSAGHPRRKTAPVCMPAARKEAI
jgi:hypothetical protein